MARPQVSIAMCTYNGAQYLEEQLKSITIQTLAPSELVICDDKSTDDTTQILEDFAGHARFPVRIHLNEKNLGSTENFARAIARCTGEIIALADQDDVWLPTKLERIVQAFSSRPQVGVVFSDAEIVDDALHPMTMGLWSAVRFTRSQQRDICNGRAANVLLKHNVVTGATMALQTSYRDFVLPIPSIWSHDAWIALLISFVGELEIIREPLILYRQHAANQIGVIKKGSKSDPSGERSFRERCLHRMTRYGYARERVGRAANSDLIRRGIIQDLENKLRHIKARYEMASGGWHRVPIAIRELTALHYHRYSKRDRAFISDLFRRE